MKPTKVILISFLLLSIFGCKEEPKEVNGNGVDSAVSTFYFIRHAEKDRSNSENTDPELNQIGLGRAMHWAEIMRDIELDAIYSTDFKRTTMTAAPISVKQDVDVEYYDPSIIDMEQFKADNFNRTVLIVGHSNTTPDFVNAIIGEEKYTAMADDDNGSLFVVQATNESITSQQLHINCSCPDER